MIGHGLVSYWVSSSMRRGSDLVNWFFSSRIRRGSSCQLVAANRLPETAGQKTSPVREGLAHQLPAVFARVGGWRATSRGCLSVAWPTVSGNRLAVWRWQWGGLSLLRGGVDALAQPERHAPNDLDFSK